MRSWLTAASASPVQAIFLPQPPEPHLANFCIFSRMGFHHVDQDGLDLLTPDDPPASSSQSAGIAGMSHHAQPQGNF